MKHIKRKNPHTGSNFEKHFKEQFKDPEFGWECYKNANDELTEALKKIEVIKYFLEKALSHKDTNE